MADMSLLPLAKKMMHFKLLLSITFEMRILSPRNSVTTEKIIDANCYTVQSYCIESK